MTFLELYTDANSDATAPPNGVTVAEQLCWWQMKNLITQYRDNHISDEQAKQMKSKVMNEFEHNTIMANNGSRAMKWIADLRLNMFTAITKFRKDPCVETADKFLSQLEGFEPFELTSNGDEDHG